MINQYLSIKFNSYNKHTPSLNIKIEQQYKDAQIDIKVAKLFYTRQYVNLYNEYNKYKIVNFLSYQEYISKFDLWRFFNYFNKICGKEGVL